MRTGQRRNDIYIEGSIYSLKIKFVRMKVKFQCKMKIQCNNDIIASEISAGPQANTYNFNQDVVLTEQHADEHNTFTLSFFLVTSKGTKYIAALAHLFCSELTQFGQGHPERRMVINLTKCLDPDAIMQIFVKQITHSGVKKHPINSNTNKSVSKGKISRNFFANTPSYDREITQMPLVQRETIQYPSHLARNKQIGSQSQVFHSNMNKLSHQFTIKHLAKDIQSQRNFSKVSKNNLNRSTSRSIDISKKYQKSLSKSKVSLLAARKNLTFKTEQDFYSPRNAEPDNYLKRSAYEQSTNKLRNKLQNIPTRQDYTIPTAESKDNYAKFQQLRFMMLNQQLQKKIVQKTNTLQKAEQCNIDLQHKVTQLTSKIAANGNNSDNISLIAILEEKISMANQQLEELRTKFSRINRVHSDKERQYQKKLQLKLQQIESLNNKLTKTDLQKSSLVLNYQNNEQEITRKNLIIQQLQIKNSRKQQLVNEKDRVIGNLRQQISSNSHKIEQLTKKIASIQADKQKSQQLYQNIKNKHYSSEISNNTLNKIKQKLESELIEANKYKQRYNEKMLQIKKIEGEQARSIKNYQNSLKINTNNFSILQQKYKQEVGSATRNIKQLEQKYMSSRMKVKQLENTINFNLKNQIQNYKKQSQRLHRQCEDVRASERNLTKQKHTLQGKLNSSSGQLELYRNKCRSLETQIRVQAQKFNSENRRIKEQLDQQMMRNLGQRQRQSKLMNDNNIISNKLNTIQETHQRQLKSLTDKAQMLEKANKKYEQDARKQQLMSKETKQKQRELINKLRQFSSSENQYTDIIKDYQQQLTSLKQQYRNTDSNLKNNKIQLQKTCLQLKEITQKYQECYHKHQQQMYEHKDIENQYRKQQKNNKQYLEQIQNLKNIINTKQKQIEKNKNHTEEENKIKANLKEKLLKTQLLFESTSKQNQRFHQYLLDIICRQMSAVQNGSKNIELFQNQSNDFIKQNGEISAVKTPSRQLFKSRGSKINLSPNNEDKAQNKQQSQQTNILNLLNQYSKQIKQRSNKWQIQYQTLQKIKCNLEQQLDSVKQDLNGTHQSNNHTIAMLKQQLVNLKQQYVNYEKKTSYQIKCLQDQLGQLTMSLQTMKIQYQQLNFTLNGTIMQKQSEKEYYSKVFEEQKVIIQKLEQKIENQYTKFDDLEQQHHQLQKQLSSSQVHNKNLKTDNKSRLASIQKLQSQLAASQQILKDVKQKNKVHLQHISELELQLANEQERMHNNMQLMQEQGKKLTENKEFINNLIKQKENIVKQEISNVQKIIELQSMNSQYHTRTTELEQNLAKTAGQLSHEKQDNKKLLAINKQLQTQIVNFENKNIKSLQKIKQKERKITVIQQNYATFQAEMNARIDDKNKDGVQKSDEYELKQRILKQELQSLKLQMSRLQDQVILKLNQQLKFTSYALQNSNKQLQKWKKLNQGQKYELSVYKESQDRLLQTRQQLQADVQNLLSEIREKDERIYSLEGQISALEHNKTQLILNHKREIKQLQQNWEDKQELLCQDYEARLEQLQKQNKYIKAKTQIDESQLKKINQKYQILDKEAVLERQILQNRLIKLEQQKNSSLSQLKSQLKKMQASNHSKEQEIIKKNREVETIKNAIKSQKYATSKLQEKIKQYQSKMESLKNSFHEKMQKQKKKDLFIKNLQEQFKNYQWGLEREIRKIMQSITKGIIEAYGDGDTPQRRKFIQIIRDAENNVVKALATQKNLYH